MKLALSFFVFFLALPTAFADTAVCRIAGARPGSIYAAFVGGQVSIRLEDGVTKLTDATGVNELAPISSVTVSSFGVSRSACIFGTDTVIYSDGSLRAKIFNFNECVYRDPATHMSGYIKADVSFDLAYGGGKYREIFLTPTGIPPSAYIDFDGCRIETAP